MPAPPPPELIAEAEGVELEAMADLHDAAGPDLREALGLGWTRRGGAAAETTAAAPDETLLNRVIGLGVEQPATEAGLDELLGELAHRGLTRYLVHVVPRPDPPELRRWLADRGLAERHRAWMKFTRGTGPPASARTDLTVAEATAEHAAAFGEIVAGAFGLPPALAPLFARLVGRARWTVRVTLDEDGTVAGCGALFVTGDVGWLSYGATRESHRGRGSQGAVLARRVADARDLGARLLVTETGEAVAGQEQHSYRNIERAGFVPRYRRENWCPVGPP